MAEIRRTTTLAPNALSRRMCFRIAIAGSFLLFIPTDMMPVQALQKVPDNHDDVIVNMEHWNSARQKALQSYRSQRRYDAGNSRLGRKATVVVEMKYMAPDIKSFQVLESQGSQMIRKRAIEPLLESEQQTTHQQERRNTEISRENYSFTFTGTDNQTGAFIFHAEPRKPSKYLFRGKIWIDPQSFGIMRIDGEPAKSPSFWVRKTHFVHVYARFDDFWFPISNRTEVELLIFGKSTLSIDYYNYEWQQNRMP